ncbi:MAG: hypothetical protein WCH65_07430 [bacterium]
MFKKSAEEKKINTSDLKLVEEKEINASDVELVEEKEINASDVETLLKDKELSYESCLTDKITNVTVNGYKGPLTETSIDKKSIVIRDIIYGPFKRILKKFFLRKTGMYLYILEISNGDDAQLSLQAQATIQWYAAE